MINLMGLWDEVIQEETLIKGDMYETEMEFNRKILIHGQRYKKLKIITKKEKEECPSIICSNEDGVGFLYRRDIHGKIWDAHAIVLNGLRGEYVKQHKSNSRGYGS